MAKRAEIVISDHNDASSCSLHYTVRFKLASDSIWTTLTNQQPEFVGSPGYYALYINNLEDDFLYDYEIIRYCCEGNVSTAASGTFTSTDS